MERVRHPAALRQETAEAAPAIAPPPLPAAVLDLQRTAGNRAVGRMLARAPAPAATAAIDPMPAVKAVNDWRAEADVLLDATTAWETANWIEYLSRTSSNPRLTLADSELAGVASNALGNLLTELGAEAIKNAARWTARGLGAAIGTAVEPGAGTAVGFLIGVLVESVASFMFELVTGKSDPGEKAADAAEEVGRLIQRQHALLSGQHGRAAGELEALVATVLAAAEAAESQSQVDAIARWFTEERPATRPPEIGPPYPMAQELLRIWVLEHAGDLDTPHPGTDATQWERVATDLFGPDGIAGVPIAFTYQTRAEWARAGLDHAQKSAELKSEAAGAGDAAAVEKRFHRRTVHLSRAADAAALHRYLVGHDQTLRDVDADWMQEQLGRGAFDAWCEISLDSGQGTVYVSEWRWRFAMRERPPVLEPGGAGGPVHPDPRDDVPIESEFDVWPTWG